VIGARGERSGAGAAASSTTEDCMLYCVIKLEVGVLRCLHDKVPVAIAK
jgi:hypothetical protein